jgi:hypothetical protein
MERLRRKNRADLPGASGHFSSSINGKAIVFKLNHVYKLWWEKPH